VPRSAGGGLGGHCIPIDPFYLSWKARQTGFESRFIELAGHINAGMPRYVVELTAEALNSVSKPLRGARVHVFGIAYKPNVADVRESPALDVVRLLQQRGAIVTYSDPHVGRVDDHGVMLEHLSEDEAFDRGFDCAVITTDHRAFDYRRIGSEAPLVVDTRNALKGYTGAHIFRL
jgi:UDP-N-acetyl-D-glucosamine dehydrogenase